MTPFASSSRQGVREQGDHTPGDGLGRCLADAHRAHRSIEPFGERIGLDLYASHARGTGDVHLIAGEGRQLRVRIESSASAPAHINATTMKDTVHG